MTTEEWFEQATLYFGGAMPAAEAALFEKATADSKEFTELMQLWKNTDAEAAVYEQHKEDAAALISTHQKLKAEFINDKQPAEFLTGTKTVAFSKQRFSAWKWIAAAAAITGIVLLLRVTMQQPGNATVARQEVKKEHIKNIPGKDSAVHLAEANKQTEKKQALPGRQTSEVATLYAQNFTADKVPENQNGLLADAFFYYNNKQYKETIDAIDNAGKEGATRGNNTATPLTNFYALYYKGLSMMLLDNAAGAIPVLQQSVLQSPSPELTAKAQWYLALAYMKEEKISFAIKTSQSLINNPGAGAYKKKAEKLIAALKK